MLELVFIRHAHSCGNAKEFSNATKLTKLLFLQTLNPHLSDLGLLQIAQARSIKPLKHFLDKVDYVFCSDMVRAMETSLLLFPKTRDIQVIPFIGESSRSKAFIHLNLDIENQAQGPIDSIKRLKALGYDTTRFDYEEYVDLTRGKIPFPSFKKFMSNIVKDHWMNLNSLFCLLKSGKTVRVAIVTHGNMLKEILNLQNLPKHFLDARNAQFQPAHCHNINYEPTLNSIGNIGIVMFQVKNSELGDPQYIYDTNAVYDEECMEYLKEKRFLKHVYGTLKYVKRCSKEIQGIFA